MQSGIVTLRMKDESNPELAPPSKKPEQPSLWQLRVFESVARHESVTHAAHDLLRSQPAVTSSITELEAVIGAALFERSSTGTYLTAIGVAALVRTRRILDAAEQAVLAIVGEDRSATARSLACGITRTQMRSLVTIEECGTFRAAARRLGFTEASLQRAARTLEQSLGAELFRRTASGVQATDAGRELARRLQEIRRQIDAMVESLHNYDYPKEQLVSVGVLLLDPTLFIVSATNELAERFPDTRTVVINGTYDALLDKLLRGEIDIILGLLKHPDAAFDFVEEPLFREKYCVVGRREHPLARMQTPVDADALRRFHWILPPKGSPRRAAYEHVFSDGSPPRAAIETYSLSTIRLTLADSDMLTVLSATEVVTERRLGLLDSLRVDVPCEGPMFGITTRRGWRPTEAQAAFLANVRRSAESLAS